MKFDLEKMKGKVIHCNTEEKANNLLEFLINLDYTWVTERSLNDSNWNIYREQTCYCIDDENKVSYGSYNGFMSFLNYIILEFEDIIIQDKPKICEILGVEIGEKFNIRGYSHNPCVITQTGNIFDCEGKNPYTIFVLNIIQNPELIEKIPEWTDEQKEIFKALRVLDFNYIA